MVLPTSETMESTFKEVEIPVPWGTVRGKWWGPENCQPILALHGWQDNCGSFDSLAQRLAPEFSLLCIDLPGHGLSTHYPEGMTYYIFWDTLVLIRRIVNHFSWTKVSIIGHSLGGAAGFMYAAVYPKEVDKLISIDIVCPRVAHPQVILKQVPDCIDKFLKYEGLTDESQPKYDYDEMVKMAMDAHRGSLTRESCEVMMKRGMEPLKEDEGKYKFIRDPRLKVAGLAMFSKDQALAFAGNIKCEYLNIRAKPGIQFELKELYEECLDKIKGPARRFEYKEIPGTHHVHMNDPEGVANIVKEFLSKSAPAVVCDMENGVCTICK